MTEIYKVKTGIAPELMEGVFEFADISKYNRSVQSTESYGNETAPSISPRLCDKVPKEIISISPEKFKKLIKSWIPKDHPCKIWELLIKCVGYL